MLPKHFKVNFQYYVFKIKLFFKKTAWYSETSQVSKRLKELNFAGFNAGIDDIQKVHSRDPRLKDLHRKCDPLKI